MTFLRWTKRALVVLGCIAAIALITGTAAEAVMRAQTARRYPVKGRLVDIGGRRLQLDCRGTGSPTVILEAGLDYNGSLSWAAVHDSIARTTRVCAYSRAGIMWSDPSPQPFDARAVARDLHAALVAAGESPPWISVGHSLGGPYAMLFTRQFGAEVRGLVLVDASHPDQFSHFRQATGKAMEPATGLMAFGSAVAWTGIIRLTNFGAPESWPTEAVEVPRAYLPQSVHALLAETRALPATLAAAGEARDLGSRPLVVLTAARQPGPEALAAMGFTPEQWARKEEAWRALHDDEAKWSSASEHEVVDDASHYIQFDRPEVVIKAVREVVWRVRAAERPASRAQ